MQGYGFVIDTEEYAGSHYRETVAFMTGQVGECGNGEAERRLARAEMIADALDRRVLAWCDRHIQQRPDEHGCRRPVDIYPTPGWLSDGLGGDYRAEEAGSPAVAERYRQAAKERGYAVLSDGPGAHPAYLSVVAWFDERPPAWVVDTLKRRAATCLARPTEDRDAVKIAGYRVVRTGAADETLETLPVP